jgi:predicted dinucleotide-binding enzyme
MKIGVLGTGAVAKSLGKGFLALGHDVRMGSRTANNEKAVAWAQEMGARASVGTFADTAAFGDLVVLATLGVASAEVLGSAGPERLAGKILIDTTNPLKGYGATAVLAISGEDSGGETVQRLVPGAKVVKAFNIVGNHLMFRPQLPAGPPDMFIAGNDAGAKQQVTQILKDFGWGEVHDLGGIEASRYLEAMCLVWVLTAVHGGGKWNQAFKMLR